MANDFESKVRELSIEKALAVAAYGESVAAYRYRTLKEKTPSEVRQRAYAEMAEEEQSHRSEVLEALEKHFPDSDFVLTAEDKELVVVGPRMLDVTDEAGVRRAFELMEESEHLAGRFYACLADTTTYSELKPLLKRMADVCVAHAQRLHRIPSSD